MTREARLPPSYYHVLSLLGLREGRSTDDLLREAVDEYLARHGLKISGTPRDLHPDMTDEEWSRAALGLLTELHQSVEADLTPDEIETEITAASEDLRRERLARRRASHD